MSDARYKRIYVAAPVALRDLAASVGVQIRDAGFSLASTWWEEELDDSRLTDPDLRALTGRRVAELLETDALVHIPGRQFNRGGNLGEVGYVLARGKPVFLLGEKTFLFHYHPRCSRFGSLKCVIEQLGLMHHHGRL